MRPVAAWALAALVLVGPAVHAAPHRLDDSLTHTVPPNVRMSWRPLQQAPGSNAAMEAWLRVNVRLDTREWQGRQARIYMVMERDEASMVEAVWTTQGLLQSGRLTPGERVLVFAGPVPGATLDDQLQLRLRADADWTGSTRRLNFHFELETD